MSASANTPITYQKNYENHIERILEGAERLFIRDGIDSVSMNAIADEARIARKTLYKYFSSKQEIALAIFKRFMEQRAIEFDPNQIPAGNGYQRLEYFLLDSANLLDRHPEFFRFLVEFDALYARDGSPERTRQMYATGNDIVLPIIRQGMEDGTIRSDINPGFLLAAIYNLISGMNTRFALVGNQIGEEYGQSVKELHLGILRIFLQGIRRTTKCD